MMLMHSSGEAARDCFGVLFFQLLELQCLSFGGKKWTYLEEREPNGHTFLERSEWTFDEHTLGAVVLKCTGARAVCVLAHIESLNLNILGSRFWISTLTSKDGIHIFSTFHALTSIVQKER